MNPTVRPKAASVHLQSVTKRYAPKAPPAVDRVTLSFQAGCLTTLLGPSGCGKTTTLRMIAGLEKVSDGRILIGDDDVTRLPATQRDVSMVFQSYALFPHLRVVENVRYGLEVSRLPRDVVEQKTQEVLRLMGLQALGARYPHELSGGQQQRVAVARALVLEPRVLLFDEPLSNLDAKLRRHVRQEIRELQRTLGLTAIYVTHDQEEALAVSDTIVVMNNAVVAQAGSPRDLHEAPATRFVADFIGEANVLPAQVGAQVRTSAHGERVEVQLGPLRLVLPGRAAAGEQRHVAIRPARVRLHAAGAGVGADAVPGDTLPGEVRRASYLGETMEYVVSTPLGDVLVSSPDTQVPLEPGAAVAVELPVGAVVLLQD
jgi:iron(III) transport system ATP-binding protein